MPEAQLVNPSEHRLAPDETLAAEAVFRGVYETFADKAKKAPSERTYIVDGKEQTDPVDKVLEFVLPRFKDAKEKIKPLAEQPTSPSELHEKLIRGTTAAANEAYYDNPLGLGVRLRRADRVVNRATDMSRAGETDGLTIKLFFNRLSGFKQGLSLGYNDVVRKTDEPRPDDAVRTKYDYAIRAMLAGKSNVEEQESGGFSHVNSQRYQNSGEAVTERYYISPKINGQPEEVVEAWMSTLKDLELDNKIYYKVAERLSRRYETVAAYAAPETAGDMQRAIQEFTRRCPSDLLSDTVIPTGVEVAKGVARAPEPHELNKLLRYSGEKEISYNELACALTELALRRASYEFVKKGITEDQVTPKKLSESAKPYFVQFVKLSGLDPATMGSAA